jgi:acetyltransferase-like isoleucine patch superfamily enzyme
MIARALAQAASRTIDQARSRLALAGATRLGSGIRLFGSIGVANAGELVIGDNVVFVSSPASVQLLVGPGAKLVIGDGCVIESGTTVRARRDIVIGRHVRVGVGCILDDDAAEHGAILVQDQAWLEGWVILLAGARVEASAVVPHGAVLGASADGPASNRRRRAAEDPEVRAVEARIRAAIGCVVPSASAAERGDDLRSFKGWDSLAALRIVVALEREFGVTLPCDLFASQARIEALTPHLLPGMREIEAT